MTVPLAIVPTSLVRPKPWWLWWVSKDMAITLGTIYVPKAWMDDLPRWMHVLRHEAVHLRQQAEMGLPTFLWRWLTDAPARLALEAEGYAEQVLSVEATNGPVSAAEELVFVASLLAGPSYRGAARDAECARIAIQEAIDRRKAC